VADGKAMSKGEGTAAAGPGLRPRSLQWPQAVGEPVLPAPDSYSLRLVSGRRLYDGGVLLGACPGLGALVPAATVRANANDLEKLGVGDGGAVRVRSGRGQVVLDAVVDGSVPRGVVAVDFNLGGRAGAGSLIDGREPVVDVRLETP
ncbi:MAG: molybdopterin dinucleotide binding domain-containing protein, partial [Acidimicrobiales bacterium]